MNTCGRLDLPDNDWQRAATIMACSFPFCGMRPAFPAAPPLPPFDEKIFSDEELQMIRNGEYKERIL